MRGAALVVVCVFATGISVVSNSTINYCGARMCDNTNAHTFCQYPEGPSPQCIGYISAELSNEEKSRVVARLNRRRNEAAAGRLRGLNSAGNMLKLRWVQELAREAQRWADQCRPPSLPEEQDVCRDLYSVTVGQCVASVVGEAPGLRIESMVDIWYMQNILYKGNATMYIPPNPNSSFYGDFAQIMWAQSYMVGCGRSRFMIPLQGRLRSVERLVCNIAPRGPPLGRPLWSPSAPATMCPARSKQDKLLNSLCDIHNDDPNEMNEVDPSMSLEEHLLLYTVLDLEQNDTLNHPGSLDEIFLTRLAVTTMEKIASTEPYYNSIQRRDVIEIIELGDSKTNTNVSYSQVEIVAQDTSTFTQPTSTQSSVKANTRQRISLIGRPKPYNLEELNDIDYKTENYSSSEDVIKIEKDFYAEYEFVESMEENSTENVNLANVTESLCTIYDDNVTSSEVITEFNPNALREIVTILYQNSSLLYEGPLNHMNILNKVYTNDGSNQSYIQSEGLMDNMTDLQRINLDEYLADPETVQALQEALDHMEHDLVPRPSMERQGKVRRELGRVAPADAAPEGRNARDIGDQKLHNALLGAEIERNKTLERGPMFNMVLKYMPYLKQYEDGLLSKANAANRMCLSSSFVIVGLLFCL